MQDPNSGQDIEGGKQAIWNVVSKNNVPRSGVVLNGSRGLVNPRQNRQRSNDRYNRPPIPNFDPPVENNDNAPKNNILKDVPVDPNFRPRNLKRGGVRLGDEFESQQKLILEVHAYNNELEEAKLVLSMLKASRFVATQMVEASINQAENRVKAENNQTLENYKASRKDLTAVKDQADHAASMAKDTVDLETRVHLALSAAERELAELEKYAFIDSKTVKDKVSRSRQTFDSAKNYNELKGAETALDGLTQDIANSRAAAKKSFEALKEYQEAHRTATDRLAEAKKLRGAQTDPRVLLEVTRLNNAIVASDTIVERAEGPDQIKSMQKNLLEKTETALKAAREESALVRKEFDEAIKSMPAYLEAYRDALDARDLIASQPGATKPLQEIDALLILTRTGAAGTPPASGFTAALNLLKTKTPLILDAAKQSSKTYLEKDVDPQVAQAFKTASDKLDKQEGVLPQYLIKMHRAELADALVVGKDNVQKALGQIPIIAQAIDKEVKDSTQAKEKANTLLTKVKQDVEYLKTLKAPAANYANEEKIVARVEKTFLPALDFKEAETQLTHCRDLLKERVEYFLLNGRKWKEAETYLAEAKTTCIELLKWPAAASQAGQFRDELISASADINQSLDYEAGLVWLQDFKTRFQTFVNTAAAPSGDDMKVFHDARVQANNLVRDEAKKTQKLLKELENKLDGVRSKTATTVHFGYDTAINDWEKFWLDPKLGSDKTLADACASHAQVAIANLQSVQRMAGEILSDPQLINDEKERVKAVDDHADDEGRPAKVKGMIDGLETLGGGVATHRSELKKYEDGKVGSPAEARQFLVNLETAVQKDIDKSEQELKNLKSEAMLVIKSFTEYGKKLQSKDKDFLAYFESLRDRLQDAMALLSNNDFEIVVNACKQIKSVGEELGRIRPDTKGDSAFKPVDEKIKELSGTLGKDNAIRHRMKDSYNAVYAELNETVAAVRKLPPEEGLKRLADVEAKINKLVTESEQLDLQNKTFKARCEAIEKTGKVIAKETETRVTDRCDSYYEKFKTMLAEAKAASKQENNYEDAFKQLDAIENELASIRNAPDKRVRLQELDADARQEQRAVHDLAMRWERRLAQFVDIELPRTKDEMLKRVKEGKAMVADLGQVDDLSGTAKRADDLVSQYTAIISKLPHKSLGANQSPPMGKVLEAFGRANMMLDNAARTARRLAGDPEGTNINISGDLKKIEANWVTRARNYSAAFDNVINEINSASGDEQDPEKKKNAEAAIKSLGQLRDRFKDSAFTAAFQVLTTKDAQEANKLKAREEALRVVREYRQALRNPLLIASTAGKDPYSRSLRPAFAMLETALKKIELEALVAE